MEKNPENQLQIELKEDVAQGVYCNLAVISHSSSEFVLDLIRVLPGLPKAQVKSRVILTPEHAMRLMLDVLAGETEAPAAIDVPFTLIPRDSVSDLCARSQEHA